MPDLGQVNRDVRIDVQGSVGSLGKVKAGELATQTEVVAKSVFEKYPNVDRMIIAQMMAATYCSMIKDSSFSENDKHDRWDKFQDRVFSFVGPDSSKSTAPTPPSRNESVKKPEKTNNKTTDKPSQAVTREESKKQVKSPRQPEGQPRAPAQEQPKEMSPPPVDDARIAKQAPPTVTPQDRVKAVEDVNSMKADIRGVIQTKDKITFLITHPKDEQEYLVFVSNLLSSACRETPRQCWFTQEGNPRELDRPPVQRSNKRGIVVHGQDANALANALGKWFETYSTSRLPPEMDGYKVEPTSHLIWIDIGPGPPWKQ